MENKNDNHFDNLWIYDSLSDFLKKTEERIFRFWVYTKIFTPYEQEQQFIDQSQFESNVARHGIIREAILLPDGDVLFGIAEITETVSELNENSRSITYYKLTDIRLSYYPIDIEDYCDDGK